MGTMIYNIHSKTIFMIYIQMQILRHQLDKAGSSVAKRCQKQGMILLDFLLGAQINTLQN